MSEAGGEPDVIGAKADIDTRTAWLTDRDWPALSRLSRPGAAQGPPGAISGRRTIEQPFNDVAAN